MQDKKKKKEKEIIRIEITANFTTLSNSPNINCALNARKGNGFNLYLEKGIANANSIFQMGRNLFHN